MDRKLLYLLILLKLFSLTAAQTEEHKCLSASASCGACITKGHDCAWCSAPNFPRWSRCNEVEALKRLGCAEAMIDNPRGGHTTLQHSHSAQIEPAKLSFNLRAGEEQIFNLTLKRKDDHPIDLYYLLDLAKIKQNPELMEKAKKFGELVIHQMHKITSNFRIGFGIVELSSNSRSSTFKNVLSLTSDGPEFSSKMDLNHMSQLADSAPQPGPCAEVVGWRNATRLLLLSSDLTELFRKRSHRKCYLSIDAFTVIHTSPGKRPKAHFLQHLQQFPYYQYLEVLFPEHLEKMAEAVVALSSTLPTELFSSARKRELVKGVAITHQFVWRDGMAIDCGTDHNCSNVAMGNEGLYEFGIRSENCPNNGNPVTLKLKPMGFTDEVELVLNFICECDCQVTSIPNSELCNGEGSLECGSCRCNPGRIGHECECSVYEALSEDMDSNCRMDSSTDICSNNGDCVCGTCECKKRENPAERYSGRFCECDNFNCDRANNKLCGGHGRCECRVCICEANYTGSACDCSLDTSTCLASNKQICNGRGICECGTCRCTDPKYQGRTCEVCPTCPGLCTELRDCVQCRAFGTGEKKDTCERDCTFFNLIKVKDRDKLPQPGQAFPLMHCKERDANDCWFYYTYGVNSNAEKEVHAVSERECPAGSWWPI